MSEYNVRDYDINESGKRKMIVALEGFNDPSGSASIAIDYLLDVWGGRKIKTIQPDSYVDFRMNRPIITGSSDGKRSLKWPKTDFFLSYAQDEQNPTIMTPTIIVKGFEPAFKWKQYIAHFINCAEEYDVEEIITLGSVPADVPHTKTMDVTVTKSGHGDPFPDDYQGITGVLGVLCFTADKKGFKTESIWATSPHYLPKGISPKTTLSLVYKLEDILNITIPTKELVTVSDSWEKEINIYIKDNNEMEEYVKRLEKRKQQSDISKTTGETLAEEAERYLRHYNAGDI